MHAKILNSKLRLIFFLALIGTTVFVYGVGFAPVRNFSRQTYGGGAQNWAVTQDASGKVYFANRNGMLRFDGNKWSLFHLPNYTTVRAVYADEKSGRIYVGGTGEFGYFHNDHSTHVLTYVSWVGTIPKGKRDFAEIWHINELEDGSLVFQGDYRLFISNGEKTMAVESLEKLTASSVIGGEVMVGTQTGRLYRLSGERLKEIARIGEGSRIVAILPYKGETSLIVTSGDGLYFLTGDTVIPANWDIEPYLNEHHVFCASFSEEGYAFGTVDHGAVVRNRHSGESIYINKSTGLQNNTVLGLGFDLSGNLWLCLDNGLSYAVTDSPVYSLLGDSSDYGAGYASLLNGNHLLLGTNRGLYSTTYPIAGKDTPPKLSRLYIGQVWSLDKVGDTVFVSGDDGLYVLDSGNSNTLNKINGIGGGSVSVSPLKSLPGHALASTYSGFYLLKNTGTQWQAAWKVEGYDDTGGHFVEDSDGAIWIAHWLKGVYRLQPSDDYKKFTNIRLYNSSDGLPNERENSIAIYDGKLRIATASGEFFTVGNDGEIKSDKTLSRLIPLRDGARFYSLHRNLSFAFSPGSVWEITRDSQGKTHIDSLSLRGIGGLLIPGFEHVGVLDDNEVVLSSQEGFHTIKIGHRPVEKWHPPVIVESLSSGDTVIFSGTLGGNYPDIRLPYSLNSLTFNFAVPEYRTDGVLFSCLLENYDKEWSAPSVAASKEYTRLSEGNYILRVRAYNPVTGHTAETAFSFSIAPPWYRSVWAWISYSIIMACLAFVGFILFRRLSERNARKVRLQKEAELEKLRHEAEKEAIKKDYEIASLKSEQLELDIKHKSSELSNTAMNVIRKNEMLANISGMLDKLKDKVAEDDNRRLHKEIDKIKGLIKENVSHDDDWKKFNQNFDIVYADFTKRLAGLHPDLTLSERRLCCYLKIGLASKDIAPIFSISPKSVEMNRYRLRKKLGLEREDNLMEYLQKL